MKVYWLNLDGEHPVFYSESLPTEADEAAQAAVANGSLREGLRSWAVVRYKSLQKVLHESESGFGLRMRRAWEWLQNQISPHEALPRSLRLATTIELYHPARVSEEKAKDAWAHYLAARWRYHLLWFTVNALIAPLTILLMWVPGPNVIGYWFVYRAVCHALAMMGLRRARSGEIETHFHSSEMLGETPLGTDEEITLLAAKLELNELGAFIKRAKLKPLANEDDTTLAVQ